MPARARRAHRAQLDFASGMMNFMLPRQGYMASPRHPRNAGSVRELPSRGAVIAWRSPCSQALYMLNPRRQARGARHGSDQGAYAAFGKRYQRNEALRHRGGLSPPPVRAKPAPAKTPRKTSRSLSSGRVDEKQRRHRKARGEAAGESSAACSRAGGRFYRPTRDKMKGDGVPRNFALKACA